MKDNEEIKTLDKVESEEVSEVKEVQESVTEEKQTEEPKLEETPKKEEKKKNKIILPIILIIILLLAIGTIIFFLINKNNKKESPTNSNEITISFNTNGGEQIKELTVKKEEEITLPTPTKKGFTFLGWYQGGKKIEGKVKFSENTVLLAKWENNNSKKEYTITFSPPGELATITLKCGLPLFLEDTKVPEREYEWFQGWTNKATGVKYISGQILECQDTVFEAYWIKKYVNINYQYNLSGTIKYPYELEESHRANIQETMTCTDNMKLTLPEKMPEIEGYYFDKWTYSYGEKSGKEAKTGDEISCSNGSVWIQANYILGKKDSNEGKEFTVNFDLNGGNGSIVSQKVIYNQKATKPANPSKDGYDFIGWSPDIDSTVITEDTTFTAQWKEKTQEPEPDNPAEPAENEDN